MEKSPSKTKAKRQFIILYLVSLVLIFVVVSAFWKVSVPTPAQTAVETNDDASRFMQIDTLLHAKMDALDTSIARYSKTKGTEDLTKVQRQVYFLQSAIDSVDKQASILLDGSRKQHMQLAVANFRKLMAERNRVLYGGETVQMPIQPLGQPQPVNANASNDHQKDQLIVSLQNQLKQTEAALQQKTNNASQPASGSDNEWKQKYASLKSAYEKTVTSEKALKAAYKTVAEDNRRLLNQLQTLRAEKKN